MSSRGVETGQQQWQQALGFAGLGVSCISITELPNSVMLLSRPHGQHGDRSASLGFSCFGAVLAAAARVCGELLHDSAIRVQL